MATTAYAHFDTEQLCRLLMRTKRIEVDVRTRVTARADHVVEVGNDKLAGTPDPVRKKLSFLLLKWERQRRDVESELATRGDPDCSRDHRVFHH